MIQASKLYFKFIFKRMQKSMVQELNSLNYSSIFNTKPSFINTHFSDPEFNELRKSRIMNLPGHRKQDLSAKLNFVVVFQTIQIERLSQQVEALRVKLKDYDRQRTNFENYEVQIRQLTEKCHMYQLQREGMDEQAQRMKIFCEKLYRQFEEYKKKYGQGDVGMKQKYQLQKKRNETLQGQIDKWRSRYNGMQRSKAKEMQEMRLQMQSQRKSTLNRQIKEVTIKYENEIQTLLAEARKSRQQSQSYVSEIQRLEHLLNSFQIREQEIKQIEDKMYEYQNRFVMLSQENYRLNELLRWKGDQIQKLKMSEREWKERYEGARGAEERNRQLEGDISRLNKEIEERKVVVSRYTERIERLGQQNQKIGQYQKLVQQSTAQIERLNKLIHSKISDLDSSKTTIKLLQTKLSTIDNSTRQSLRSVEERLAAESKEKDRLNQQLKNRLTQNQNYKVRITDMERAIKARDGLQRENEQLRGEVNTSNRRMDEFRAKISLLEENVAIMQDLERTLKNDQKIKQQLINERERLNTTIRNLTLQLQTSSQQLQTLQSQNQKYQNMQSSLEQFHQKYAYMTRELDRNNSQINRRVAQLQQLRQSMRNLSNAKNVYKDIEQKLVQNLKQMQTLILQLDQSRRQNQRLVNTNISLQSSCRKMQGDILATNQERQKLNQIINHKNNENMRLGQQMQEMAVKVTEHRQLTVANQEHLRKIEQLNSGYQQLQARYKNQVRKSEQYSKQIQQMCQQLIQLRQKPTMSAKMTEQISTLHSQCHSQSQLISALTARIAQIQTILKSFKQRYLKQCQLAEEMRHRAQSSFRKMDLLEEVGKMMQRYAEELNRVSEENVNLQTEKRLLDLELCQSVKVLEEREELSDRLRDDFNNKNNNMGHTFGTKGASISPQAQYKNQSIAQKVPLTSFQSHPIFTFNQVTSVRQAQSSRDTRASHVQDSNNSLERKETPSGQESSVSTYYNHERGDVSSDNMAGSFINALGQQQPGRYQQYGAGGNRFYQHQYQQQTQHNMTNQHRNNFNLNRYSTDHSPHRPSTASYHAPGAQQEIRYVNIDQQLQGPPQQQQGIHQPYTNPFQQIQQQHGHSAILEGQGIKRVTSYTHFNQHGPQHHSHIQPHSMINVQTPTQPHSLQRQPMNIQVFEPGHLAGNSSPKNTRVYGQPVRISSKRSQPEQEYQ